MRALNAALIYRCPARGPAAAARSRSFWGEWRSTNPFVVSAESWRHDVQEMVSPFRKAAHAKRVDLTAARPQDATVQLQAAS